MSPLISFGREICSDFLAASRREWLVTNGIGGYAAGTVSTALTRAYHGLLIAALQPPLRRTLLVAKLDETAFYCGRNIPLFANHWANGAMEATGLRHLLSFELQGAIPTWSYALEDAILEKRIWMQPGANTTYLHYRLLRAHQPVEMVFNPLVNFRNHHDAQAHQEHFPLSFEEISTGIKFTYPLEVGVQSYYILSDQLNFTSASSWVVDFYLPVEANRGLTPLDDHLSVGVLAATLQPNTSITIVLTTDLNSDLDGQRRLDRRCAYERALIPPRYTRAPAWVHQLILAADQFIVDRATPIDPQGKTIIAGYPWFTDWGRDTMISLPGLTLALDRFEIARKILRTFAAYFDQGMLPNRFPDPESLEAAAPEYNTVDATLWYFEALRAYVDATNDQELLAELYPFLVESIAWHRRGTRYGIRMDPADGLLYAGEPGIQLTWMDAKVDDWVVTPRIGKPVEINALWYNALCIMADFADRLGLKTLDYAQIAIQAKTGFARFWYPESAYLYDVIDGPDGNQSELRPNQLLAVSLSHSPLTINHQRAVVDACVAHLFISYGLRSLSTNHPQYIGVYGGDRRRRDGAYHQGTAWSWLIGPFASAHWRVHRDRAYIESLLAPYIHHLGIHGLGSISEIFDGDPPHTPRGCFAQAWSVAELLRSLEFHHFAIGRLVVAIFSFSYNKEAS